MVCIHWASPYNMAPLEHTHTHCGQWMSSTLWFMTHQDSLPVRFNQVSHMRKYLGSWLFRYSNTSTGLPLEYSTVSVCCMYMYMGSMMWVWGWWWEHVNVLAQLRFVSYTQTSHSINKSQYQQVQRRRKPDV